MKIQRHTLFKIISSFVLSTLFFVFSFASYADQDLISLFPIEHYDQNISTWIKPSDVDYDQPLMSEEIQQKHFAIFLDHYVGVFSPWNADYVNQILRAKSPNDLKTNEQNAIQNYSNEGKSDNQIGYGENFRPYKKDWIDNISKNINISQLNNLSYQNNNRGIAIDNLHARVLPTEDVHFYNHQLAGQGFPFDNLQMSALFAGTPVYIVCETQDHAWMLVITPDYIGWVKSNGIARVDNHFVDTWSKAAKDKLIAITQTKTSMIDNKQRFLFLAYVGSVFPGNINSNGIELMVPAVNQDGNAVIKKATITNEQGVLMPFSATPHHFSMVINTIINRPYGWGSMYFYNDCSAETKSLLTPFGIWLPRHSSAQVSAGKMVDMSLETPDKRLSYLIENGKRFLTLIYIGNHIVLYIGSYINPTTNTLMAMTYQDVWGLSPAPAIRRAVIGESVLFPLLLQYPEDATLKSLAAKNYFQVSFLNELPSNNLLTRSNYIDVKSLMTPENWFE